MQSQVLWQFAAFKVDRNRFPDIALKVAEPIGLSRESPGSARIVPPGHQSARFFAGADGDGDLVHHQIVSWIGSMLIRGIAACKSSQQSQGWLMLAEKDTSQIVPNCS